jgi:hypothetical protein
MRSAPVARRRPTQPQAFPSNSWIEYGPPRGGAGCAMPYYRAVPSRASLVMEKGGALTKRQSIFKRRKPVMTTIDQVKAVLQAEQNLNANGFRFNGPAYKVDHEASRAKMTCSLEQFERALEYLHQWDLGVHRDRTGEGQDQPHPCLRRDCARCRQ